MFYQFLYPLKEFASGFNLFRYITVRSAGAVFTSMFIILLFSGKAISLLKKLKIREEIRSDGPKRHLAKSGTPTMGGILIIFSVIFSILLWGNLTNRFVLLFIITLLAYGSIGFYDDYLKIFKKKGFSALIKFILQIAISTGIVVFLYFYGADEITNLYIPFFTKPVLRMGIFFIPFSIFILVMTPERQVTRCARNLTYDCDLPRVAIYPVGQVFPRSG